MTNDPGPPADGGRCPMTPPYTPEEVELLRAHGFDVGGPTVSLSDLIAELEGRQPPPPGPAS